MDSSYKWIIDPIDGTVNFANGIPLCCVSIAIEKDGMIIMGAVYNPMMNEFFFAEKNQGAYLNDQRMSVSEQNRVKHACTCYRFSIFISQQRKRSTGSFRTTDQRRNSCSPPRLCCD